jgi:hypothetical protein
MKDCKHKQKELKQLSTFLANMLVQATLQQIKEMPQKTQTISSTIKQE